LSLTRFDVRTQLYVNNTLVAEGLTRCVTGVTRNPSQATEVTVPFGPVAANQLPPGDVIALKVSTRIGTNPDNSKCGGHNNAVGLRLYYDASSRASRFGAEITPDSILDQFLHSSGTSFSSTQRRWSRQLPRRRIRASTSPGNPCADAGTWSRPLE